MERNISNKQKEKKNRWEGGGSVEEWVLVEGMQAWGWMREPRATSMEQAEHSLLGES